MFDAVSTRTPRMISGRFGLILLLAIIGTQAWSEDLSYVGDDELVMELQSRRADLDRTSNRVIELQEQLAAQKNEILTLNKKIENVEQKLVQRTSMLYRLSKNGKSVQYLFSSDSATSFIKRMQTLRKLVTSQMDEKRDLSLQLAGVKDEVARTREELKGAKLLGEQLHAVVETLQQEQRKRQSNNF